MLIKPYIKDILELIERYQQIAVIVPQGSGDYIALPVALLARGFKTLVVFGTRGSAALAYRIVSKLFPDKISNNPKIHKELLYLTGEDVSMDVLDAYSHVVIVNVDPNHLETELLLADITKSGDNKKIIATSAREEYILRTGFPIKYIFQINLPDIRIATSYSSILYKSNDRQLREDIGALAVKLLKDNIKDNLLILIPSRGNAELIVSAIREGIADKENIVVVHSNISDKELERIPIARAVIVTDAVANIIVRDDFQVLIDSMLYKFDRSTCNGAIIPETGYISQEEAITRTQWIAREGPGIVYRMITSEAFDRSELQTPSQLSLLPKDRLELQLNPSTDSDKILAMPVSVKNAKFVLLMSDAAIQDLYVSIVIAALLDAYDTGYFRDPIKLNVYRGLGDLDTYIALYNNYVSTYSNPLLNTDVNLVRDWCRNNGVSYGRWMSFLSKLRVLASINGIQRPDSYIVVISKKVLEALTEAYQDNIMSSKGTSPFYHNRNGKAFQLDNNYGINRLDPDINTKIIAVCTSKDNTITFAVALNNLRRQQLKLRGDRADTEETEQLAFPIPGFTV